MWLCPERGVSFTLEFFVTPDKGVFIKSGIGEEDPKWQLGHRRRQHVLSESGILLTLEPHLAEVKNKGELKLWNSEPQVHGNLLHAMIH
jgi:hypothetical protein